LDAGVLAVGRHGIRHQALEQAHTHARLKHAAAAEAQALQALVDRADHALAGVVRVLGGAARGLVFLGRERGLQALAKLLPAVLVAAGAVREDAVGDLRGPPAGEPGHQRALGVGGLAALLLQGLDQLHDLNVALGRGLPAAVAGQLARLDPVAARRAYRPVSSYRLGSPSCGSSAGVPASASIASIASASAVSLACATIRFPVCAISSGSVIPRVSTGIRSHASLIVSAAISVSRFRKL